MLEEKKLIRHFCMSSEFSLWEISRRMPANDYVIGVIRKRIDPQRNIFLGIGLGGKLRTRNDHLEINEISVSRYFETAVKIFVDAKALWRSPAILRKLVKISMKRLRAFLFLIEFCILEALRELPNLTSLNNVFLIIRAVFFI